MKLLSVIQKAFPESRKNKSHLKLVRPNLDQPTREEVIYRKNGHSIDKIIEIDVATGYKIKTTHFDYFNDRKIRSIDEYDPRTKIKIRTTNYVLYKSIDEYDVFSGKKCRTINFNIKDESKISSIQEYDIETGKITTISIYKRDGKTVSIVKKIDPVTEKVTSWINNDKTTYEAIKPPEIVKPKQQIIVKQPQPQFAKQNYDKFKQPLSQEKKDDIAKLIDNLYSNNMNFESIKH